MFLERKLVRNYTSALFAEATKQKKLNPVLKDLTKIQDIISADEKLYKFLLAPIVGHEEKWQALEKLLSKVKYSELALNFLRVLIKNNRINTLSAVIEEFSALLLEQSNIKLVNISSYAKLGKQEIQLIKDFLQQKLPYELQIETQIDKKLMGGVVIKYDSVVIDCSIAGSIEKITRIVAN